MYSKKKTPDDGQWNCPKHVEIYSKNKFEKLVHLVCFIVRDPFGVFKEAMGLIQCIWNIFLKIKFGDFVQNLPHSYLKM